MSERVPVLQCLGQHLAVLQSDAVSSQTEAAGPSLARLHHASQGLYPPPFTALQISTVDVSSHVPVGAKRFVY